MSISPNPADEVMIYPQEGPQLWLVCCPFQDIFFGGARGGGKTYGALLDWIFHQEKYGANAHGLIIRESYKQLQDFNENKAMKILPSLGAYFSVSKQTWYMPNGADLRLGYLQTTADAKELQGAELTWFCVEEIGNFPNTDLENPDPGRNVGIDLLKGSMRSAHGVPIRFIATGNPGDVGHEWVKARYITPAPPKTPFIDPITGMTRVFIPSSYADNPLLARNDPTYLKRLEGCGPSHIVKAWIEGDWNISVKGNIFEREWFGFYDWKPELAVTRRIGHITNLPKIIRVVQSWDTGCKDKEDSSKSAGLTWAQSENEIFILDRFAQKIQFPTLVDTSRSWARKWQPVAIWVEDRSSGIQLVQTMRRGTVLPYKGVQATKDKITRAHAISTIVETGKVLLPSKERWAYDLLNELTAFPMKGPSDEVDAFTLGLQQMIYLEDKKRKIDQRVAAAPPPSIYGR